VDYCFHLDFDLGYNFSVDRGLGGRLKLKFTFVHRLMGFAMLVTSLSVGLCSWAVYRQQVEEIKKHLGGELLSIVTSLAPFIDGDLHYDVYTHDQDEFREIQKAILKVKNNTYLKSFRNPIYTMRPTEEYGETGNLEFVVMPDKNEKGAYFVGNFYPVKEHLREALKGKSSYTDLYEDQEGIWISAAAPVVDSLGDVAGIVQADYQVNFFYQEVRKKVVAIILISFVGLLFALILSIFFATYMVRPIRKLVAATQSLSGGDLSHRVKIDRGDELGLLGSHFNQMASSLEEAYRDIEELVEEILNCLPDVVLSFDADFKVNKYSSRVTKDLVGGDPFGKDVGKLLFGDKDEKDFRSVFGMVLEGKAKLPFHVFVDLAPARVTIKDRSFALSYSPINKKDQLRGVLLLGRDITKVTRLEKKSKEAQKHNDMLITILRSRYVFDDFCKEAGSLLESLLTGPNLRKETLTIEDANSIFREVHTLKGASSMLKIADLSDIAHEFEDLLSHVRKDPGLWSPKLREKLLGGCKKMKGLLGDTIREVEKIAGKDDGKSMVVRFSEYEELLALLKKKEIEKAYQQVKSLKDLLLPSFVQSCCKAIVKDISERTGKPVEIDFEIEDIRVPKTCVPTLKASLTHLLRNSIDHGIESGNTRIDAGKPKAGKILIEANRDGSNLHIRVRDDGGGVDVLRVRAKGIESFPERRSEIEGMSDEDCTQLIFEPGFSTKTEVSDVSGRGVGLDAVKEMVLGQKGGIKVFSTLGKGSVFELFFSAFEKK